MLVPRRNRRATVAIRRSIGFLIVVERYCRRLEARPRGDGNVARTVLARLV